MKMTTEKLKDNLNELGVAKRQYSLSNELIADAIILNKHYNVWEVFYLDEKGNRANEKNFDTEGEACFYIYQLFKNAKVVELEFKINTK
ncbi:hypothetical protein [Sphingobacterium detergens]|uniref:hypothetical protein n=1 Tax=Sphingobacterium detergens TaxID=1145106 RepID=UPI003AAC86B6